MKEGIFIYKDGDKYSVLEMNEEGKKEYFSDESWEEWDGWSDWSDLMELDELLTFLSKEKE